MTDAFGLHPTMQVINVHWASTDDFFVTFSKSTIDPLTSSTSVITGVAYGSKDGKTWVHLPDVPVPPNQHIKTNANTYAYQSVSEITNCGTTNLEPGDEVVATASFADNDEFNDALGHSYLAPPSSLTDPPHGYGPIYSWNKDMWSGVYGSSIPGSHNKLLYCLVPAPDIVIISTNSYVGYGGKDTDGKGKWFSTGFGGGGGSTQLVINRSADGAKSWSKVLDTGQTFFDTAQPTDPASAARPTPIGFFKGKEEDLEDGISVGCYNKQNQILRSLDAGSSWGELSLPNYNTDEDSILGAVKVHDSLFLYGTKLWRTKDGITWQSIANPFPPITNGEPEPRPITGIAYHKGDPELEEKPNKFVIVSTSHDFFAATSEDGTSFVQTATLSLAHPLGASSNALAAGQVSRLVVAWGPKDKASVLTSDDGISWSPHTISEASIIESTLNGIVFSRGMFVVVGHLIADAGGFVVSGYIWSSDNGEKWTERVKLAGSLNSSGYQASGIALGLLDLPKK